MIFDTHVHTCFSYDSQLSLTEVQKRIADNNMGVIITEHIDLNYPDAQAFKLDTEGYFAAYAPHRHDRLLLGVEFGMGPQDVADYRQMAETFPFDYILGSIHVVGRYDVYDEKFYAGKSKEEAFAAYLTTIFECLRLYDYIDCLGHIDYIARYARFSDPELYYHEFSEYIDQILAAVVAKGICLEINTRRLGDALAAANLLPIYKRYRELGGQWVTIGSDAHFADDIGKNYAVAQQMAECCNLRPVYFNKRQMQYL